jgi:hypothetical protein
MKLRSDMAKVIVERPRYGGGVKTPKGYRRYLDSMPTKELPRRESMKQRWTRHGTDPKELNENLTPLRRFLKSKVGKYWNKVHAEIREYVNTNSAVQARIMQHLWDYVCRSARIVNGEVLDAKGDKLWREKFYVHPKTGILLEVPRETPWWKQKKNVPECRNIEGCVYYEANSIWYELDVKPLPKTILVPPYGYPRPTPAVWDIGMHDSITYWQLDRVRAFYGKLVYTTTKRQLSKKEIRRLGLRK